MSMDRKPARRMTGRQLSAFVVIGSTVACGVAGAATRVLLDYYGESGLPWVSWYGGALFGLLGSATLVSILPAERKKA
ncbi:hypothetical protein [Pseudomonas sp. JG-B]|uniref:hypothetical protein n=1 Tax=Pseudomonas sp. JG-B TaxID=2603214 RepID=UPI00129E44BB|nr:hypothetical protein [Pseudomonas sp. JG-B]MRK19126.1 hypothetical protein [Pseudomonas sp. JG-B]